MIANIPKLGLPPNKYVPTVKIVNRIGWKTSVKIKNPGPYALWSGVRKSRESP